MMINFTPDGIEAGDMIGVFYVGDGDTGPTDAYTCAGFVVWDDSMPPSAITILGNVNNAFGMEEGSPLTLCLCMILLQMKLFQFLILGKKLEY